MAKKTVKFTKDGIGNLPNDKPVVYRIKNRNNENIYIGIAKRGRVKDRLNEHLLGGTDPIRGGVKIQIEQTKSISEAEKKESNIISRSKPKYNIKGK